MGRLRRFMTRIRNRLLVYMLLIGIVPIVLLGVFSYANSYARLTDSYVERGKSNLHIISGNVEALSRRMETFARQILSSAFISSTIQQSPGRALSAEAQRQVRDELKSLAQTVNLPVRVTLYDDRALKLRYSNYTNAQSAEVAFAAIEHEPWYLHAVAQNGLESYYLHDVLPGGDVGMTLTKWLRDVRTHEPYGLVVVHVPWEALADLIPGAIEQVGVTYRLIDEKEDYGLEVAFGEDQARTMRIVSGSGGAQDEGQYRVYEWRTGWRLESSTNRSMLAQQNVGILYATVAMVAGLIALALGASLIASRSITRPLSQLHRMIMNRREGQPPPAERFGEGEVGEIGNAFLDMVAENDELSQQMIRLSVMEKEAEINALQTQINPHFLYNALSSIYWLAKFGRGDRAAEAAVLLSNNFRYVLGKEGGLVTVQQELDHVEQYIKIQNIRYHDSIATRWDIDEAARPLMIPRLLLQPIVENAIYHGLEPHLGDKSLGIRCAMADGILEFVIEDNGVGVDMNAFHPGVGISNVHERIRLRYGEPFGCRLTSAPGEGTRVTITIPVNGGNVHG